MKEVLKYLSTQRVGVLAVEMPDGSPHAATVHFAHAAGPLEFIFLTERGYRKFEPLLQKKEARASLVIGTQEGEMKTLQMDGIFAETNDADQIKIYRDKFSEKDLVNLDANDVFIVFKPTWWRFTDWALPEGKTIFNSDGSMVVVGS